MNYSLFAGKDSYTQKMDFEKQISKGKLFSSINKLLKNVPQLHGCFTYKYICVSLDTFSTPDLLSFAFTHSDVSLHSSSLISQIVSHSKVVVFLDFSHSVQMYVPSSVSAQAWGLCYFYTQLHVVFTCHKWWAFSLLLSDVHFSFSFHFSLPSSSSSSSLLFFSMTIMAVLTVITVTTIIVFIIASIIFWYVWLLK